MISLVTLEDIEGVEEVLIRRLLQKKVDVIVKLPGQGQPELVVKCPEVKWVYK